MEFIESYTASVPGCGLHDNSIDVLRKFQQLGIRQFILSAMEQVELDKCVSRLQISDYFEHTSGLDNHYAASKIENGKRLIAGLQLDVAELILIGDTVHDFEVATALGCKCILIANGHQSKEVLQATGVLVLDRLGQLIS
jgi:phosphoglycolate phosphatase